MGPTTPIRLPTPILPPYMVTLMSIVDLHKTIVFTIENFNVPLEFWDDLHSSAQHSYGYGSIPINTIFRGMNIHLPAILMFTRGTRFWHTAIWPSKIWPPDLGVSRRRDSMPFHGLEQVHFPSVRRPFMMGSCCWSNQFIFYMNIINYESIFWRNYIVIHWSDVADYANLNLLQLFAGEIPLLPGWFPARPQKPSVS